MLSNSWAGQRGRGGIVGRVMHGQRIPSGMPGSAGQDESRPLLAVSMGDPGGIGPEVLVRALSDARLRSSARFRIYGSRGAMEAAAERVGVEPFWWRIERESGLLETTLRHEVVLVDAARTDQEESGALAGRVHAPNRAAGAASFQFVESAIADARRASHDPLRADAIVTGPISKQAWSLAGRGKYAGHTELLQTRFGARRVAMMFEAPRLRVVLVSAHVALMDLRNVLTIGRIFDAIDLGHEACRRLGVAHPRVGVCGLNPHAGEGGLLGDEETRLIEPAIAVAHEHEMDVRGPLPGDTVFGRAVAGEFDLIVAMYHDQGLIPVKLIARDEAVNLTVGLPVVRTSPDHGTAFDLARRASGDHGRANGAAGPSRARREPDPGSMRRAIEMAVRMARSGASASADRS